MIRRIPLAWLSVVCDSKALQFVETEQRREGWLVGVSRCGDFRELGLLMESCILSIFAPQMFSQGYKGVSVTGTDNNITIVSSYLSLAFSHHGDRKQLPKDQCRHGLSLQEGKLELPANSTAIALTSKSSSPL